MQEARELSNDPSEEYTAAPLEDNIFEWHCTLRGPSGTEFEGGLYHFRISLPSEYPFRPPSIIMLTPSGRFELGTKICISFTNYHEELWQPAWGIRTAIIGLQGFFPLKGQAAVGVGSIEATAGERKRLAKLSRTWVCPDCKMSNVQCLPDPSGSSEGESSQPSSSRPPSVSAETVTLADATNDTNTPPASEAMSPADASPLSVPAPPPSIITVTDTSSANPEPGASQKNLDDTTPRESSAVSSGATTTTRPFSTSPSSARPPMMLDVAIVSLVVLFLALLSRRIF